MHPRLAKLSKRILEINILFQYGLAMVQKKSGTLLLSSQKSFVVATFFLRPPLTHTGSLGACVHTHKHTHAYIDTYTHMNTHVCTFTHIHTLTYTHTHLHSTHTYMHIHAYIHTHACTHIHMHIHTPLTVLREHEVCALEPLCPHLWTAAAWC